MLVTLTVNALQENRRLKPNFWPMMAKLTFPSCPAEAEMNEPRDRAARRFEINDWQRCEPDRRALR